LRRKADYLWRRILSREEPVAKRQAVVLASFISLVFPAFPITDVPCNHLQSAIISISYYPSTIIQKEKKI